MDELLLAPIVLLGLSALAFIYVVVFYDPDLEGDDEEDYWR